VREDLVVPVTKFVERYEQVRTKIADMPEVVINVDESRVSRNATNSNLSYVVSASSTNGTFITSNTLQTLSVVTCIAASGHTLLVIHVLPDSTIDESVDKILVEEDKVRSSSVLRGTILNVAITRTKSGWVTTKCWQAIIRYFSVIAKHWLHGRTGILTMDRLACHGNNERIAMLKKIGLECVSFPAKTSHFLQPLDQTPFAMVKRTFKSFFIRYSISSFLHPTKNGDIMRSAFIQAEVKAHTMDNVKAGFIKSGVNPWHPTKIINTARSLSGNNVMSNSSSPNEEEAQKVWCTVLCDYLKNMPPLIARQTRRRRMRRNEFTGSEVMARDQQEREKKERKTSL